MPAKRDTPSASLALAALVCLALLAAVSVIFVSSVGFTSSPAINSGNSSVYTLTDLTCSWIPSSDTMEVNITWYNGTTTFLNTTNPSGNTSTVSNVYTKKGETWNCTVTLYNDTSTLVSSVAVTVANTQPGYPVIKNSTGSDTGNFSQVTEDTASLFTVNATDDDLDTLSFYASYTLDSSSSFCSLSGRNITCNATNSSAAGPHYLIVQASDDNGISLIGKVFTFNVTAVNDAPQLSLANQTMSENGTLNYSFSATDEETNTPFNFTIVNASGLTGMTITNTSPSAARIDYVGKNDGSDVGNWTITVQVMDNGTNGTSSMAKNASFNLGISSVNHEPNITGYSNPPISEGSAFLFKINASDTDNNTLTFTISSSGCPVSNFWNITTINAGFVANRSNATGTVNATATNNTHVVCRDVIVTVSDGRGGTDQETITFNITNVNDAPVIHDLSYSASNTLPFLNINLTNLTAYNDVLFRYVVNASDPDTSTYASDTLTFSINESAFQIDSSTGMINFTKDNSSVGNYSIRVNVTDSAGNSTSKTMTLRMLQNSMPYFSPVFSGNVMNASEGTLFTYSANASDIEDSAQGLNVTYSYNISPSLSSFSMNLTTGVINLTPGQTQLGNYTVNVTATDSVGASTTASFTLAINNTPDAPRVVSTAGYSTVVANRLATITVIAEDEDLSAPSGFQYETLSFSFNITGPNAALFSLTTNTTSGNRTTASALFTPSAGDAGNYSVNVTVSDLDGYSVTAVFNFTVHPESSSPRFELVRPFKNSSSSLSTNFSFGNASVFASGNTTAVNFSENLSIVFDANVSFDTSFAQTLTNLTFQWYVDGALNQTVNQSSTTKLNLSYGFFSSGTQTVNLVVTDARYSNASFQWNVTVEDFNRRPVLSNALANLTGTDSISGETTISGYFSLYSSSQRFYDPDDDTTSDGTVTSGQGETFGLTIADNGGCSAIADLTVTGTHSLKVTPTETGTCYVVFNATDGQHTATSNNVTINISAISNSSSQSTTTTVVSSGGGGSTRIVVPIPLPEEVETPKPLRIVTPKLVTIFRNQTLKIPIEIENTWNSTLYEVSLSAETNVSGVEVSFSRTFFTQLEEGEKQEVELTMSNYRTTSKYEIQVHANVTDPDYKDTATIFVNSLDYMSEGDEADAKITFARDLLSENPECIELNEILMVAEQEVRKGNYDTAADMVNSVVNGCRYLVSLSNQFDEKPVNIVEITKSITGKIGILLKVNRPYIPYAVALAVLGMILLGIKISRNMKRPPALPPDMHAREQKPSMV